MPHSAQLRSMRIGFGVVRIERRDEAGLMPKFAFDGQLQFLGLVDRVVVALRNDVVRFRKPAFIVETIEPILAHEPRRLH